MPSAANTALSRYELWVRWLDGRTQRTPLRYHEHVTIGPAEGAERARLEMGPRDHRPKVVVHLRGNECPAMALVDLARGVTPKEWLVRQRRAKKERCGE